MYPRSLFRLSSVCIKALWIAVGLIFSLQICAQNSNLSPESYSVYYLVAGNGHYEQDRRKFKTSGFIPYDNLPEAIASAEIVTKFLQQYAHAKGITFLSSPDTLITRRRLGEKLVDVLKMMERDSAKNPMLVFYYCGHGLTEGLFSGQYLLPGDFTYVMSPDGLYDLYGRGYLFIKDLPATTISVSIIVHIFSTLKMPYCILLDCCRKESERNRTDDRIKDLNLFPGKEDQQEMAKDNQKALQNMNRNFVGEPVVFSSAYDEIAYLYDVPPIAQAKQWALDTSMQIGPLCRRMLLLRDQTHRNLTLNDFITLLKSPQGDEATPTPYSNYAPDSTYKNVIFLTPSGP